MTLLNYKKNTTFDTKKHNKNQTNTIKIEIIIIRTKRNTKLKLEKNCNTLTINSLYFYRQLIRFI